jgi:pimeloyl-ACP methyl ester carboxylesterase
MTSPTLVLIPGSWHKPACYDKITTLLRDQHQLKCVSIALPSTADNPAATFKDDIDAARAAISNETTNGRNVVVVAHSYGGMVGNSAIKGFTRGAAAATDDDTENSTTTGHVFGLILIASGFTFTGLAFMDPFLGRPPPSWRVNSDTGYADLVTPPRELFYHDLPAEEAEYWVSQLTTQSLKSLFEGGEYAYAGWQDLPAVWYIGTVEDRGLPVLAQRMTVGMARAMGCAVEHRELQTSHSPFLSMPEETVRIMVEAVEAFAGTKRGGDSAGGREEPKTGTGTGTGIVPKAMLWQPATWFRIGLPLALGRVLGRGILLFRWGQRLWTGR